MLTVDFAQWAKITKISDLTGGHAKCLSADILNGDMICEGISTTKWARRVKPAKKHWGIWWQVVCTALQARHLHLPAKHRLEE